MDNNEKKAKADETKTEEQKQQPFNVYLDYLSDPRFADFTPHNQKNIDENGQTHYSLFPDRSAEQLIIEKTVLNKKLVIAGILILVGIIVLLIEWLLSGMLKRFGITTDLRFLSGLLKIAGGILRIAGAAKLVTSLHSAITVKDILRYSDAIDKKMQKNGDEGDLKRWRERLRKLREAQANSENETPRHV